MNKPSIPKGTRDFLPDQVLKRQFIFDTARTVFTQYGFVPIETSAMEDLQTLTGKYGEEGDRLLFKILNNGDYLAKADTKALDQRDSQKLLSSISKRGLRYDLTVPFARYVVMNQQHLQFPFKRYQIQPVWRADRPQKGRYQEFFQCDVDVVGSPSLVYEAELIQIYDKVFQSLGLHVIIKVNNRKVLFGLAESIGATDQFVGVTVAIDKLDKIGQDGVTQELLQLGLSQQQIDKLLELLKTKDLTLLEEVFKLDSPTGLLGITELKTVFSYNDSYHNKNRIAFDITLARGLSYYTGCIFEVAVDTDKHPDVVMGSVGGGGRYDDLTGLFGMKDMSGVGVSFGAERIFDVMESLSLFPKQLSYISPIIFLAMDDESLRYAFELVTEMRTQGITCDLYPEAVKFQKQMKYANAKGYPYVGIIGESERESGEVTIKHMDSGKQEKLSIHQVAELLTHNI